MAVTSPIWGADVKKTRKEIMNPGYDHPQCHAFVHGIGGWHETSNELVAGAWALDFLGEPAAHSGYEICA